MIYTIWTVKIPAMNIAMEYQTSCDTVILNFGCLNYVAMEAYTLLHAAESLVLV